MGDPSKNTDKEQADDAGASALKVFARRLGEEGSFTAIAQVSVIPSSAEDLAKFANALEDRLKIGIEMLPVTLDLPDWLHKEIGRVVARFAFVEWALAGLLAEMLGLDRKEGRVMFGDRLGDAPGKIRQLCEMRDVAIPDYYAKLASEVTECSKRRNLVGHGAWAKDPDTGEFCVQNPAGEWEVRINGRVQKASKRKYPEAVYPDEVWFAETHERIALVITLLKKLSSDLKRP